MAESVGQIGLDLVVNQNQFQSQLKGIKNIAKKAGAVIAGAFAVKGLKDFGQECLELGSDLAEVQNVVDVAFPKMSSTIDSFAKNAASQFGLSETMAKRYAGTFGSMSKAFGFTEEAAADMSTTLTGLAGDVASFYNISQDEAYTKLKSVFTGETESLKDLGVVMTQTALDQYALANGFGKTTSAMSEQEKVALRYAFVQDQLSDASGDFERTSDGWANQMRILSLQMDSLKATLGQGFINLFTPIIKQVNTLLGKLDTLANAFKSFTELITGNKNDGLDNTKSSVDGIADSANEASDNVSDIGDAAKKAAKKAQGALADFDELRVMSSDESESSGSGSSGGMSASVDYGNVAHIGNNEFSKLEKTMGSVKKEFTDIAKLFSKGFSISFKSGGIKKIQGKLGSIKDNLINIFTDPKVINASGSWVNSVVLNLGKTVGAVSSIATSISAMLIGGISKYLEQSGGVIKDKIVQMFDLSSKSTDIVGNFTTAIADIFTVFEREQAQQIVADILSIFTIAGANVLTLCMQLGTDILDAVTSPIINNKDLIKETLEKTIEPISNVVQSVKDSVADIFESIQNSYDTYVAPALGTLKKTWDKTAQSLLKAYNKYIAPALDKVSSMFDELLDDHIVPMFSKLSEFSGKVWGLIATIRSFIQPFIDWLIPNVFAVVGAEIGTIWSILQEFVANVSSVITGLITAITGVVDFVTGVFTGDWKKAWDGILAIFSGFWTAFKALLGTVATVISAPFKAAWTAIRTVFGSIGKWFKNKFNTAWEGIKSVFSNPGEFFAGVWGGITGAFGNVTKWFKDKFSKAWQAVKDVFSTGGKIFNGIKDGIAGVFKTVVNGLIDGINRIITVPFDAINGMLNMIRNVGVANVKPFEGLWDENPLTVPQIPKLAKGAVIPPRAPFLAMLGDQRNGTNIETPLDTMIQAFETALDKRENSAGGNIEVNVYLEGDAKGVFKLVKTEAKKEENRTGKPAFS